MNIHQVAADLEQAAGRALDAGVDADLPDGLSYATLGRQVREGKIGEALVDRAVRHMLELKFRAGLFENPYADAAASEKITNDGRARSEEHTSELQSLMTISYAVLCLKKKK